MSTRRKLFVETTAAIARICGSPETRAVLAQVLDGHLLVSSTYVWDEFRRTYLRDAVLAYEVLLNCHERGLTFVDAVREVRRQPGIGFRPRRLGRSWDIVAGLLEPPLDTYDDALDRLEKEIRSNLRTLFFMDLQEPLENAADCRKTDQNVAVKQPPGARSRPHFELNSACSKEDSPECGIVEFWSERREALEALAGMTIGSRLPRAAREELDKVRAEAKHLLEVLPEDESEAYGERCHVTLADAIITLESPPDSEIVTSNEAHYGPLCTALGRPSPLPFR